MEDRLEVLGQDWIDKLTKVQVQQISRGLKIDADLERTTSLLKNTDDVAKSILLDSI